MTGFMHVLIWFLVSPLIGQVDTGIEESKESVEDAIGSEQMDASDSYEPAVQIIKIAIAAFSILLFGLSISAYKKTALKGIMYAAAAFGLFAIQLLFDYAEDAVPGWEQPYNDVIYYAMTLGILLLFFIAVVRRSKG